MAIPAVIASAGSYIARNKVQAILGSLFGSIVAFSDKLFGSKKKALESEINQLPKPIDIPPASDNKPNLLSLISEQNKILHVQMKVLSSLADAIALGSLGKALDNPDLLSAISNSLSSDKANDKEAKKAKNPSQKVVEESSTSSSTTTSSLNPADSAIRSLSSALDKQNLIMSEQSKTISALQKSISDGSVPSMAQMANALNSLNKIGLKAEVTNNLKVANEVNVRKLNAELLIDKPVDIALPASVIEYQKSMLQQKTKEVENSTKTFEIYKEQDTYQKTSQNIKDLDGKVVASASPRDIAVQRQAVQARTYTDENSFELSDSDINSMLPTIPDISKIFDFKLPHQIDKEFLNG